MTDHFAVLHQPRRPWLEVDALKEQFRSLAGMHHPDVAGAAAGDAFAAINAAFTALRDPVSRLRHLLELQFPEQLRKNQAIPSDLSDRFMQIATLHQRFDSFRQKRAACCTPLGTALLASERERLREDGEQQLTQLHAAEQRGFSQVRELDAEWSAQNSAHAEQLAVLHARLSHLAKWSIQLREDQFALSD